MGPQGKDCVLHMPCQPHRRQQYCKLRLSNMMGSLCYSGNCNQEKRRNTSTLSRCSSRLVLNAECCDCRSVMGWKTDLPHEGTYNHNIQTCSETLTRGRCTGPNAYLCLQFCPDELQRIRHELTTRGRKSPETQQRHNVGPLLIDE